MDKKSKKQIEVLRPRLQRLQQQLAGATRQCDDPAEVERLKKEIATTQVELERLKNSP